MRDMTRAICLTNKTPGSPGKTLFAALFAALMLTLALASGAMAAFPDLGRYWEDSTPELWRGTWTRRGNSNAFDARWTHPRYGQAAAYIIVNFTTTNRVTIVRTDTIGPTRGKKCRYTAEISEDGRTISGSSTCDWAPGPHPFRAVIRGQTYRLYRYPRHPRQPNYPVDYRLTQTPGNNYPGKDPADAFCRAVGFRAGAYGWKTDNVARGRNFRTAYMGNNQICTKGCIGYAYIQCRY